MINIFLNVGKYLDVYKCREPEKQPIDSLTPYKLRKGQGSDE